MSQSEHYAQLQVGIEESRSAILKEIQDAVSEKNASQLFRMLATWESINKTRHCHHFTLYNQLHWDQNDNGG